MLRRVSPRSVPARLSRFGTAAALASSQVLLLAAACTPNDEPKPPLGGAAAKGMLPASQTAAEKLGKADGFDPRDDYPEYYGFTGAPAGDIVLPGEFEPTEGLLLGWDASANGVGNFFPELAAAASQEVPVIVYASSSSMASSARSAIGFAGGRLENVSVATAELDSIWMRDYGPLVVRDQDGDRVVVDARYYWGRWNDDYMPTQFGSDFGLPVARPALEIEGGNLLSDGKGRCVTTEWLLEQNASAFGYDTADVRNILAAYFGCENTTFVPPMLGEGTGHVDMSVIVTGPRKALVGRYTSAQDSTNASRLDTAADRMEAAGWQVTRIPMPDNDGRQIFRSYTNALAVNDVVLVPIYDEDNAREAAALDIFSEAYPDRTIVPVDSDEIIYWSGAVHCVTMTF